MNTTEVRERSNRSMVALSSLESSPRGVISRGAAVSLGALSRSNAYPGAQDRIKASAVAVSNGDNRISKSMAALPRKIEVTSSAKPTPRPMLGVVSEFQGHLDEADFRSLLCSCFDKKPRQPTLDAA
jgi:hypothetical protein